METWSCSSVEETEAVGALLARRLAPDGVLLLEGDLGSGKTVCVRGLARSLGVAEGEVQSPSYSLIHEHQGTAGRLVHVDLYRLEPEELDALGLEELLAGPGVKAVEWARRLAYPPAGALRLEIRRLASGARQLRLHDPAAG